MRQTRSNQRRKDRIMTLEWHLQGEGSPDFIDIVLKCMKAAGKDHFNRDFLSVIEKVIQADQCMIYSFRTETPDCYLSFNNNHQKTALLLAQKYLSDGYKSDPLRSVIDTCRHQDGVQLRNLADLRPQMSELFYKTYFADPGIVDVISVVASSYGDTILMNFYRYKESGLFSVSEQKMRHLFWDMIAQIVLLHYSKEQTESHKSPLNTLSSREQEVCKLVLKGLTTEAIAWQLGLAANTVTTYRKRSYEKLGINSKSALFALCNTNEN
ncbi:MAG TPA: hypothetical protein DCS30_05605 [Rhizobiales bacterium]|nr:hypothetical protein [Hyphomicrobiales bacterium]